MLEQYVEAIESNNIVSKTDIHGIITFVNDEFCKISKYSREELIGQDHNIVRHPDVEGSNFVKLWETILSKKTYKSTVKNLAKDGSTFYVNTTIFPILDEDGNINEFVAIRYDVTEATQTEQKLKHRDRVMYQQARLASMGEMIANIAHQWRQPLSELTILLYEIKKDFSDSKQEKQILEHYKKSQNLIKKMSQTIDDFRNFFDPHKPREYFCIKDVIDEAMYILKDTLKNENIDVKISADKNIKIFGFTNEFSHVLINILNNAKDAFYKIDKKNKIIKINVIETIKEIKIDILDNATGIDKNKLKKVFEPYYTTKQNLQGTGLGLYIAKMIVEESLNGKLTVQNSADGVCFTIVFQKEDIIDR